MADPTAVEIKTRTDVFPDYVMAEPPFTAHLALEAEMEREAKAEYVNVAVRVDPARFEEAMAIADRQMDKRPFAALSDGYYARVAKRKDALTPHLVWACLRRNHPQISMNTVNALIQGDKYFVAQEAALDLFGFTLKKASGEAETATAEPQTAAHSITQASPEASANAA